MHWPTHSQIVLTTCMTWPELPLFNFPMCLQYKSRTFPCDQVPQLPNFFFFRMERKWTVNKQTKFWQEMSLNVIASDVTHSIGSLLMWHSVTFKWIYTVAVWTATRCHSSSYSSSKTTVLRYLTDTLKNKFGFDHKSME